MLGISRCDGADRAVWSTLEVSCSTKRKGTFVSTDSNLTSTGQVRQKHLFFLNKEKEREKERKENLADTGQHPKDTACRVAGVDVESGLAGTV